MCLQIQEECDAMRSLVSASKEREANAQEECEFRASQLQDANAKHEEEIEALNLAMETLRKELDSSLNATAGAARDKADVHER